MLSPSAIYEKENQAGLKYILRTLTADAVLPVRPAAFEHGAYVLPVKCERGDLAVILANPMTWRQGKPLRIIAPPGEYIDL